MLYYTEIDGQQLKLEIIDEPDGHVTVKMPDGRELRAEMSAALGGDFFTLLLDHASHEVYVAPGENKGQFDVTLAGSTYPVKVETERQHRLSALAPRAAAGGGEVSVKAPMPGLVTIVSVEVGQEVTQGERLIVLEAMKMENELKASRPGKVKAVHVQKGQTVEQNKVLVVLE